MYEYELSRGELKEALAIKREAGCWGANLDDMYLYQIRRRSTERTRFQFELFKDDARTRVLVANAVQEQSYAICSIIDGAQQSLYGINARGSYMAWKDGAGDLIDDIKGFNSADLEEILFKKCPQPLLDLLKPYNHDWRQNRRFPVVRLLFEDISPAENYIRARDPLVRMQLASEGVVLFGPDRTRLALKAGTICNTTDGSSSFDFSGYFFDSLGEGAPGRTCLDRVTRNTWLHRVSGSFLTELAGG